FEDQAFFYYVYEYSSGSTSLRGFCSYDPNTIPELGIYMLPDNTVLVGVDLLLHDSFYIDEGHTLTLIDSTMTMGASDQYYYGLDLINDGTLILINSTIVGNNSKSIFDLPGRSSSLYMYDSYLDIHGEIEGYFEAHGEGMFYNYKERKISLNDCDVIIEGLDLNLGVIGDPQYSRDELFNMVGDVTLTFEGCRLESIFRLINGDDSFVSFHNCSLKEIIRLVYDESYYGSNYVDIRNVINTTFHNVGMIEFSSEKVENCTFIDCNDLTLRGNSRDDLSVINCEFIGIYDPIELEDGGNLRIINCLFSDFDNAIHLDYIDEILISNTTFQNGEWGIYAYHFDTFVIEDCTFEDLNISIYIDEDEDSYGDEGNLVLIENNLFLRDNLSIFYRPDNPYDFDDYYSYDYGDDDIRYDIDRYDDLDFLDCRHNIWDDEDPDDVAGKVSPGIYFLPYNTPDGTEISTSDNDMDGMDDTWEERNHLDNLYYFDRYLDPDRDFYSNYEEYRTGTDPFDKEDSPGKLFWSPSVVLGLIFTILLISLFISYLFYIQRARRKGKMIRFEKVYAAHYLKMRALEKREDIEPREESSPPPDPEEKEPLSPDVAAGSISEDGTGPGQKAKDTTFKVVEAKVITTVDEEVAT
ncbi:MAG: right-handed parallel beta-helix repeat-containing protein, partial [Thermoplasmata archaeon]|nr:right-handed parallel beta-helix repeat-containing protein [Thermoplasmata archaeon]